MFLAPFTSKSVEFYEIIRPKGAEKQAVSLRNTNIIVYLEYSVQEGHLFHITTTTVLISDEYVGSCDLSII